MTPSQLASAEVEAPGPAGLPVVGNLLDFERDRLGFLERTTERYGPVVRFSKDVFLVSSPEFVGRVLRSTNEDYRMSMNFAARPPDVRNTPAFMRGRAAAAPGLGRTVVLAQLPIVQSETERRLAEIEVGDTIDVLAFMEKITESVILRFCFGDDTPRLHAAARSFLDAMAPIVESPLDLPRWLPTLRNWRAARAERELTTRFEQVARTLETAEIPKHSLRAILGPHENSANMLMSVALAGYRVPAAALAWLWLILDRRPACRRRVEDEVAQLPKDRCLGADDLARLPFLGAVIKEVLRLYPPTWHLTRVALRDHRLGPYEIREGQGVLISPYVAGRDRRYFDDPTAFLPQRWLDEVWVKQLPPFAYFPFGAGARACIGARLATYEMMTVVATIARRYRLRVPARCVARPVAKGSLIPGGLRAVLEKR